MEFADCPDVLFAAPHAITDFLQCSQKYHGKQNSRVVPVAVEVGGSSSPHWMGDSHGALSVQAEPFTYFTALAAACRASVTLSDPPPILEHFPELQVVFKHLLHFQQSA